MPKFVELPIVISVKRDRDQRALYNEILDKEVRYEWDSSEEAAEYYEKHALIPEMSIVQVADITVVHGSASGNFCNVDICSKNCIILKPYDYFKKILIDGSDE